MVRPSRSQCAAAALLPPAGATFPPYLREGHAASYLSVSPRYLRKLVALGRVPIFRLGRRAVLFRRADLDAAVARCRVAGSSSLLGIPNQEG